MPVTGKVAIVTGAAQGLGAVMSSVLAEAGALVSGMDIGREGLDRLDTTLNRDARARVFLPIVGDVSSPADSARALAETVAAFGRVDILVNNAGLGPAFAKHDMSRAGRPRFFEANPEGCRRTLEVNSFGPFLMAHTLARHMMGNGWGRIINVTTSFQTMVAEGFCVYGPSKAALEASTALWAKELAGTGVTANVLIPGGAADTGHIDLEPMRLKGLLLPPRALGPPLVWLSGEGSDGWTGRRFLARLWDERLGPDEAARRASSDAAWPDLAAASEASGG
jgi:NAD(P)-dependent dehydrogenase (short-subunit alcohol dehydrogenase family)